MKNFTKNHIIPIALFIFISGGLLAQGSVRELRIGGSPVAGTLSSGEEIWYHITAAENSILTVETFSNIDTYLEAYEAQNGNHLLAQDDDGGENANARIEMFVTAGKQYMFKLRGFNAEVTGSFRILATSEPIPTPTELRFGATVRGNLNPGTKHWYSVRTRERGFINVETFGDIDTYMEIYDAQYNQLAADDDGGIGMNALIEMAVEPNQVFLLHVRGINNETSGQYEVSATFDPIPADRERNTERPRAVGIKLGEAVPVFFHNAGESRWYRYEIPRAGTRFMVQTRGNIDTMLYLRDSQGNLISENDDSGEGLNALIYERLNAGVYFIEVKTFGETTGRCTLHAETR